MQISIKQVLDESLNVSQLRSEPLRLVPHRHALAQKKSEA
jgi:hypothetical protein